MKENMTSNLERVCVCVRAYVRECARMREPREEE